MENIPGQKSEYNDGENVTHYLGNDDYEGANLPENNEEENNELLEGKEALGNDLLEEEEEIEEKFYSSMEDQDYE
jgi:hypothetical protein